MPVRLRLTEALVGGLTDAESVRRTVYDAVQPGLVLRITPKGARTWYVLAWAGGRQRWVTLGPWPRTPVVQARELAREALVQLSRGQDPTATKREAAAIARGGKVPTLDALGRHLAELRDRGRSALHVAEVGKVVQNAVKAGVKDLADPGIAVKADRWLRGLDLSDMTRNRYRAHLVAVGKTALRWWPPDVLGREPFLALTGRGVKMPAPPVFTPQEACRLLSDEALAHEEEGGLLWAFLLYTGCRYKEAAWATWDRIDLARLTFQVVPPTDEERQAGAAVKRDKTRTVPLQPELVTLLLSLRCNGFLFSDRWRTRHHYDNIEAFRRHLARLGIPLDGRRIHALRHTHACLAIASGEDSLRLRLSMGHAGEAMAAHYAGQAMRWRSQLAGWNGIFHLRDPVEVARLLDLQQTEPGNAANVVPA